MVYIMYYILISMKLLGSRLYIPAIFKLHSREVLHLLNCTVCTVCPIVLSWYNLILCTRLNKYCTRQTDYVYSQIMRLLKCRNEHEIFRLTTFHMGQRLMASR
jgi:hypothetical protein